ncbi:MAG TPA: hypothetical protein VJA87_03045 [Candidatus Paceibacterota bacterium]
MWKLSGFLAVWTLLCWGAYVGAVSFKGEDPAEILAVIGWVSIVFGTIQFCFSVQHGLPGGSELYSAGAMLLVGFGLGVHPAYPLWVHIPLLLPPAYFVASVMGSYGLPSIQRIGIWPTGAYWSMMMAATYGFQGVGYAGGEDLTESLIVTAALCVLTIPLGRSRHHLP